MSFAALKWVDSIETLSPSAKVVLFSLAQYASEKGESWPSQEVIARKTCQSIDSVQRRLKEMVQGGYLHLVKRKSDCGTQITNLYILLMDDETRAYAARCGWRGAEAGENGVENGVENGDEEAESRAADCGPEEASRAAQRPQPGRTAPVAGPQLCGTNISNNLSKNLSPLPPNGGEREGAAAPRFVHWDEFRRVWPFDPTELPGQAAAEFASLTDGERALAVARAPLYIAHCKTHGRKIAHARTWLSGRGWEAFAARSVESAAAKGGAGFVVEPGTPQAAAWTRYLEAAGERPLKFIPTKYAKSGRGAWRPSEWPPAAGVSSRDGPHAQAG